MEWTPLLAVIVGSTGIIGAVAAAVQLSRRARLGRSIKAATKAAESVAGSSQTRELLQQAIEMDVLRLAAGSIITVSARSLMLHIAFLAAPVISFAVAAAGGALGLLESEAPWAVDPGVVTWMGIIMTFTWVVAVTSLMHQFTTVYRLREEWVSAAILAQSPPVRTPRMRSAAASWRAEQGPAIDAGRDTER